jgi:hypothetical protein
MSYKTEQTWFYYLNGRNIQLYQRSDYGRTDTLGSYKIRLPDDSSGTYFIYPDEDITDGLRMEYTSLATPFIAEGLEDMQVFADGANISFALSGTRITTDNTNNFWDTTSGFAVGDKIRVIGSASNDADYTIDSFGGSGNSNMVVSGSTLTDENAGQSVTIYQIPKAVTTSSADESSHMNLNRMLSLACADYLKAMLADREGDIERKEYYMKEFWGKVGDNQSNKLKISMSFPSSPYALK